MQCAAERHVTLTCCRGYPHGTRSLTQSLAVCRRGRRTVWRTDPVRVVSTGTQQTARWNSRTEPLGKRLGITWWWYERRCNIHAEKDAIFPKCELLISVETIRTCESNFHEPTFQIFSFKRKHIEPFLFICRNAPSRLCKRSLFQCFSHINPDRARRTYRQTKDSATDYRNSRNMFEDAMETNGYGPWVRKPPEVDMFYL